MQLSILIASFGGVLLAAARLQPRSYGDLYTRDLRSLSQAETSPKDANNPLVIRSQPITGAAPASSASWGTMDTTNSNPYTSAPSTGVTRTYTFNVARATMAPDGTQKEMIVINGQFPGPQITANWGDMIQVTVNNQISGPSEGLSLHWHGFLQSNSQWQDGVPGTAECPITPGGSRTYLFQAQLYGTSWYHSHYSAQYAAGAWGPIVVHGPSQASYDVDFGAVTLTDLYYKDYFSLVQDVCGNDLSKVRPASDNNLINGMGCLPSATSCSNLATFQVTTGKRYLMRLINTSAAAIQKFSIDGHNLTVIAQDYVAVKPFNTSIVTLGVAQRTDVILTATGNASSAYWIRSNIATGDCTEPANGVNGKALLQYQNAHSITNPSSTAHVDNTQPCMNDPLSLTQPAYSITPGKPDITQTIPIDLTVNSTGHLLWLMNNQTYRADYNDPVLLLAKGGNDSYPLDPQFNVQLLNSTGSIRVILENSTPNSHPMHLHGHNMYVLAFGTGSWDGTIVNSNNPQRRDVFILPANGFLVVQWDLDNPGVWPMHCHIAWHVSAGFQMTWIERPSDVVNLNIPQSKFSECTTWNTYTQSTVVDQIDSGV